MGGFFIKLVLQKTKGIKLIVIGWTILNTDHIQKLWTCREQISIDEIVHVTKNLVPSKLLQA